MGARGPQRSVGDADLAGLAKKARAAERQRGRADAAAAEVRAAAVEALAAGASMRAVGEAVGRDPALVLRWKRDAEDV